MGSMSMAGYPQAGEPVGKCDAAARVSCHCHALVCVSQVSQSNILVHGFARSSTLWGMDEGERALVIRAQSGDNKAFSALVESNWVRLVRFARSVAGSRDAEDAVQDGLVKAWRKLASLRDPGAFSSWVLRIVSRECCSHARGTRRLIPLSSVEDLADLGGRARIETVDVERVLAILPPRQRAVMHLTVVEGMSDSEIAVALDITPASVRSHRRRAKTSLNCVLRCMQPQGGEIYENARR